jgi:hypothetical protein
VTGAADRLAAARSAMESATREHQEQRGLRERHLEEAKAQARQSMERDAAVHGRYLTHLQELNRRRQEAGGWLTEKALADRRRTMEFGPEEEDDRPRDDFGKHLPPKPPGPIDAPIMEGPPPASPPAAASSPPTTPIPVPPPRPRHGRTGSFDDDDFSNNSWLVD